MLYSFVPPELDWRQFEVLFVLKESHFASADDFVALRAVSLMELFAKANWIEPTNSNALVCPPVFTVPLSNSIQLCPEAQECLAALALRTADKVLSFTFVFSVSLLNLFSFAALEVHTDRILSARPGRSTR